MVGGDGYRAGDDRWLVERGGGEVVERDNDGPDGHSGAVEGGTGEVVGRDSDGASGDGGLVEGGRRQVVELDRDRARRHRGLMQRSGRQVIEDDGQPGRRDVDGVEREGGGATTGNGVVDLYSTDSGRCSRGIDVRPGGAIGRTVKVDGPVL